MSVFCITEDNQVKVFASRREVPGGAETFQSEKELGGLAAQWPSSRLVEIWNQLTGAPHCSFMAIRQGLLMP
jgi:hypothetical protein